MQRSVKPLLALALLLLLLTVLVEFGATALLGAATAAPVPQGADVLPAPGLAVPALALFDSLLLWVVFLVTGGAVLPPALLARVQGAATLVATLLAALAAVMVAGAAMALLTIMSGLLLAPPFGTVVYLAVYGAFDLVTAQVALSTAITLKLVSAGLLVAAHWRFLENRSLVLLMVTSLGLTAVVALLHGIVPNVLVSITDAIAAVIAAAVTLLWAVPFAVGGIISALRAVKPQPVSS